jgi:hypothetical protein
MQVGLWIRWWGWGFAVLCCGLGCVSHAQAGLTVPTNATSDQIVAWLTGSDQRMVAWGAYFAGENKDAGAVPYLKRLAEQWQPMPARYSPAGSAVKIPDADSARERAMYSVLDALIRMHESIAPEAIPTLAKDFGGQAMTLFAYLPETERRRLAESIYAGREPGAEYFWTAAARPQTILNTDTGELLRPVAGFREGMEQYAAGDLIHVAAAMLANDPPPGFAASLMNETTVLLTVSVGAKANRGVSAPCVPMDLAHSRRRTGPGNGFIW